MVSKANTVRLVKGLQYPELQPAYDYMDDVLEGNVVVGAQIKQLVRRHFDDMKNAHERGFVFSEAQAARAIRFFKILRHTKGMFARKPFQLQPFQAFIIAMLDGWRRISDGGRRFTTVFFTVSRKNGKTEFMGGGYGTKGVYADNEFGADVFFCATKRDQAKIGFSAARTMVRFLMEDSPKVFNSTRVLQHEVKVPVTEGLMRYLSSDHDTLDGYNPHIAFIDEYHAHKTSGVLDVMKTGQGSRLNPLLIVTTTAGFNINGPCYAMQRVCGEILQGFKQDDSLLPVLYTLDTADDWNDESVWPKSNPNLDVSISMKFLREQYVTAFNEGMSKEVQFKTKNLNIWTSASTTWVRDREWMECAKTINIGEFRGRRAYLGLDLASVRDLCCLAIIFPMDAEEDVLVAYHFMPKDNAELRERNDGVPFGRWAVETDRLTITNGNVTDYRAIKAKVMQLMELFDIRSLAYDRYNASQIIIELQDEGLLCNPFGQGFVSMSAPTKGFERAIIGQKIIHDGDPILRWEIGNVMLRNDPAGNIKVDKSKSAEKVDGVVASIMAFGEMIDKESGQASNMERYGIRTLG